MKERFFEELFFYTLSHHDGDFFIHQLAVDAYTAQTVDKDTKRISIVFALVGLYLFVERGYTGREIQKAHMALAKYKDKLPEVFIPDKRGDITVEDVLAEKNNRDEMIKEWCKSVWNAYKVDWEIIRKFCEECLF